MSEFKVGDLATYTIWTDAKAGRIVAVSQSGNRVTWQEDKATLLNGVNSGEPDALEFSPGGFVGHTSGRQRWQCEPNPEGRKQDFSRRVLKSGWWVWKGVGERTSSPGGYLSPGQHPYHDFNF